MSATLAEPKAAETLTQRKALAFWLPLALSWLCMAAEAPICQFIINHSPNATVNMAAFQLVFAIAIFIEAPVIDLLSTSTTLGKTRRHYVALSRFAWTMMIWVTAIHALVVWTPIYDWVTMGLLHQDPAVAGAALWPLRIMTLWSAFIGWRRYLQGLMIRNGATKAISLGTLLRVATIAGVGLTIHFLTKMDGLMAASIALLCSVAAESFFIHFLSRTVVREHFHPSLPDEGEEISQSALLKFHIPLTLATMVTISQGSILTWALAQSESPVENQAAFPLASGLVWLFRTATFALPEVVIALADSKESRRVMATFSLRVGLIFSSLLMISFLTGADEWWLRSVLGADEKLIPLAKMAILLSVLLPLLGAAMSFLRGCLTGARNTWGRLSAIGTGVVVLFLCLWGGIQLEVPGIWNVCISALIAQGAEMAVLVWSWSRTVTQLELQESAS